MMVTASFVAQSEYSFLSQTWQSIAQLWSPETEVLLESSSMSTDNNVKARLKAAGMDHLRVGVGALGTYDRIALTSKLG